MEQNPRLVWRAYVGKVAYPTIIFASICITAYVLTIYAGLTGLFSLTTCCIINTVLAYLLFTPMHEAVHGNIRGRSTQLKIVEHGLGWLSGAVLMVALPVFRYIHLTHHSHTNDEELDPDYWVASRNPFFLMVKCFTMVGDYYYFFFRDARKQLADEKLKNGFIIGTLGLLIYNSLAFVWGWQMGWQYPLLLWVLPALFAITFLAFVFDWLPHHPHAVQKRYLDTRIILFPGLGVLLLSQNLHLIHHLYPNVPFYKYGAVFKKMRSYLESKGSPIQDVLSKK